MSRTITKKYQDPVDLIWLRAAAACGIHVTRDSEVFAAWDGQGTLRIGPPESLDPDDSLAQMILHELCHALVAGPQSFQQEDWGLDYDNPRDQVFEHAALRVQAELARQHGLRSFFASTTDFRDYFDRLPKDPLRSTDDDPAVSVAIAALQRLKEGPWHTVVEDALRRTAIIAAAVSDIAPEDSLWSDNA